jgi:UDP-3-O-[3-hydroxymyristoyl] N-acetylglucosamine deacetylase
MRPQQTIGQTITCSGVGLHTGHPVTLTLRPAPVGTGIVFVRHQAGTPISLSASVQNLVPAELCTTISAKGMVIKTVEHILSALVGLGIDNVFVDLDAGEVPVMDGSAGPFARLILAAGIVPQDRRQPFLKIMQPIEVVEGKRRIAIEPDIKTRITYSIQYDHPLIQRQTYTFEWSPFAFERDIAHARTFGFLKEVQSLWSRGLGKGGSFDNTVILSEDDVVNETGLRFHDEFVRHKILDVIGDLALLGVPFIGHLVAECAGHALHTKLVEKILGQSDKWIMVTSEHPSGSAHNYTTHAPYASVHAS